MIGGIPKEGQSVPANVLEVRSHYDERELLVVLSIDPETRMYSCAFCPDGIVNLAEAQLAKIRNGLDKLDSFGGRSGLLEGKTLADVGSGYGKNLSVAAEEYKIGKGIGLNVSPTQVAYAQDVFGVDPRLDYRLQGWEEFREPVDAVISIGAFEHFGRQNYPAFFQRMREILPEGGLMLLHTIIIGEIPEKHKIAFLRYLKGFLGKEIFPGGDLPTAETVREQSQEAGFELISEEHWGPYYAKTLREWAKNLKENREEAIRVAGRKGYYTFLGPYFRKTADWFDVGALDLSRFLLWAS